MNEPQGTELGIEPTRAMTLILLVLSNGPKHGYAIMTDIVSMSDGLHRVSPGTLYRSIGQLLKHGMIDEAPELLDPEHDDERRKYYRITGHGKRALTFELIRLEKLLQGARSQGIFKTLATCFSKFDLIMEVGFVRI